MWRLPNEDNFEINIITDEKKKKQINLHDKSLQSSVTK